ncbi:murein biosynthesis integral membrane protein MurJ [Candidatus Peregrinibacteria bacterium RIFCSPLOWO2_02_FULL_39_10]|nr:MAG: murein biosynthesis integral membrane protein MurJ [Candidatus Peregrinibacteria bacterium RIFCSPLOWO2_02_FULL_39_10]
MYQKLFKPSLVGGATILITVSSLLSYLLGLARDRIIAVHFGTTSMTDAYNASFLIPDFIFNLFIAGALSAAFLPVFSQYLTKNKEEAHEIANTMLTSAFLAISVLSVVAIIFMGDMVPFLFSGAAEGMQKDITNMTRLMLIGSLFFSISNTLGNILMGYKHFVSYAISPVLYNLGIILGVIFLQEKFGIYSASIGVLIGSVFHCLIRVIDTFNTEYKFKPKLSFTHPGFIKIIKLMIPKSISLIAWQLNMYVFAIVGIKLIEGGLAAFNFARNIQSFAVSLFGIAFSTAVFPYLTSSISEGNKEKYTYNVQKTIQRILFFTIPAAVGIGLLAKPIIEIILSGGAFNENSVDLTATILFFFAVSIPFESLSHILSRSFYAFQNTITPTIINVLSMGIIASFTFFVAPVYGIEWFSIGFSTGFIFYVVVTVILLKRHLQGFNLKEFLISLSKTLLSSGIMAMSILLSLEMFNFSLTKLNSVLNIVVGATAFFAVSLLLRSKEIMEIKARLFNKRTSANQ